MYHLDVQSASAQIRVLSTTGTNISVIRVANGTATAFLGTESSTGAGLFTGSSAYATVVGSVTSQPLQFGTNDIIRATIDTSGSLGLGTTAPTNILSFGNAAARKIWIENSATDVVGRALTVAAGGAVAGTSVSDVVGGNLILQSGLGTGTGASTISFQTGTTLTTGTTLQTMSTKMTILGSGNVGIGTAAPLSKLDINGGVAVGSYAGTAAAPSNGLIVSGNTQLGSSIATAGAEKLQVTGAAYISDTLGIGTAATSNAIEISKTVGIVSLTSATGTNRAFYLANNTGGSYYFGAENSAGNGIFSTGGLAYALAINAASARAIQFGNGNTVRMTIDTAGNVGIGTTTPTALVGNVGPILEVASTGNTNSIVVISNGATANSSNGSYVEARSSATLSGGVAALGRMGWVRGADVTAGKISSNFNIQVNNDGTVIQPFSITSTGNVGIGTTSPNTALDVIGAGRFSTNVTIKGVAGSGVYFGDATTYNQYAGIYGSNGGNDINIKGYSSSAIHLGFSNSVGQDLSALEAMTIKSNGTVGIGNTNPQANLDVAGSMKLDSQLGYFKIGTATVNAPAGFIQGGGASTTLSFTTNSYFNGGVGSGFTVPDNVIDPVWNMRLQGCNAGACGNTNGDAFVISRAPATASTPVFAELFRISPAGNVGIGTASPSALLNVTANYASNFAEVLQQSNVGGYGLQIIVPNGSTNAFSIYNTAGAYKAVVNADGGGYLMGNVGIGMNAPGSTLQVNGAAAIGYSTSTAAPTNGLAVAGNVGIGTTSPGNPLQVNSAGSGTPSQFRVTAGGTGGMEMLAYDNTDNEFLFNASFTGSAYLARGTTAAAIQQIPSGLQFSTNNGLTSGNAFSTTARMTIDYSGNVGIGTTTPTLGKLQVVTAANSYGIIASDGTRSGGFYLDAGANAFGIGTLSNHPLEFFTNNASISMFISTAGNVGIGNTGPSTLLYVGSSSVTTGTTVATFQNAGGTCAIVPSTSGGVTCSSDMNLKKNITTLADNSSWNFNNNISVENTTTLQKIMALTPVNYNWNVERDTDAKHAGFIAQEVRQVFPDLVSEDPTTHLLSLNYTGFMPYTIQAIQEMNVTMQALPTFDDPTLAQNIATFLRGIAERGEAVVNKVTAKKINTQQLCIGDDNDNVCVTKDQLRQLLQANSSGSTTVVNPPPPAPTPDPDPAPSDDGDTTVTPPADSGGDSTPADVPEETPAPTE